MEWIKKRTLKTLITCKKLSLEWHNSLRFLRSFFCINGQSRTATHLTTPCSINTNKLQNIIQNCSKVDLFNLILKIFWKKALFFTSVNWAHFSYFKWYTLNMVWYILIYSNLPWHWVFHNNNTNHLPTNDQIIIAVDAQVFYKCSF